MEKVKPTLVVMAAGMGSRYGGLKQIDPVDEAGHKIVDFSVFDACRAGFGKVVFIIKKENLSDFQEAVGDRIQKKFPVEYAFQSLEAVPEGTVIPEGRVKPWGTAHAVLSAKECLDGPFAVINADDFYGQEAFRQIGGFLTAEKGQNGPYRYAMAGFQLRNTLTDNGSVARGICSLGPDGELVGVEERTCIEREGNAARYSEDGGESWTPLTGDETVSMNFWGFEPTILGELETSLKEFFAGLSEIENPLKAECYLPGVVDRLIHMGKARVDVLPSTDRWFGVTYREDKPFVMDSIRRLKDEGVYPDRLWD
ncbi:MAG: nucleotidyltransferase [Lachnospiraceae bacterium]|nr:nucleotidyltransferase [Lachnospiraceae bacterium]